MAPPRTGTVQYVDPKGNRPGYYRARIRCPDGTRPWVNFDPSPKSPKAEARARQKAAAWTERAWSEGKFPVVRRRGPAAPDAGETCAAWWKRYFAWRKAKGQSSVADARGRVRKWVEPHIGPKPLRDVTRADLEAVVRSLDKAVGEGRLSWKTARNVWGEVTSAFGQACTSKEPTLRVRDDDPTDKVQGPDGGVDKAKPILYPDEAVALLACSSVPLERRRVYAVAMYTGARANELAALTAADVDLAHTRLTIAKQVDRETGDDRQTKTKRTRSFDVEGALLPLLRVLVRDRKAGRLLTLPVDEERARLLREDLIAAGVTRAELHTGDKQRVRMWLHHLRDTCLTWMAVRGDEAVRIQFRGGHTDFKMTQAYIAAGRNLGAGFGKPFPELPSQLLGDDEADAATSAANTEPSASTLAPTDASTTDDDDASHAPDPAPVSNEPDTDDASADRDWSSDWSSEIRGDAGTPVILASTEASPTGIDTLGLGWAWPRIPVEIAA